MGLFEWLKELITPVVNISTSTPDRYIKVDPTVNDIRPYSVAQCRQITMSVAHASGGYSDPITCLSKYMIIENISTNLLRTSSFYWVEWQSGDRTYWGPKVLQTSTTNPGFPVPTVVFEGQRVLRAGESFRIAVVNSDGVADYTYTFTYRYREVYA